ncbi:MAG: hypothetical protein COY42_03310 [Armatimonadetes bacterium CG_4_10_14_0_8_um_filter_66_14]|nr:hypothetical protein [Armatimonadota bacterium]OIP07067.1 MAG: hypothetical protein AUJ96_08225 [Armatimonadetes bacterium CG2_30_66_41]PIZ49734.1 MAG: hypothetical protein COY42_03310 [Armatimonadetes bacterium CG_4_10_14_0_8_um_filter_66_14]
MSFLRLFAWASGTCEPLPKASFEQRLEVRDSVAISCLALMVSFGTEQVEEGRTSSKLQIARRVHGSQEEQRRVGE